MKKYLYIIKMVILEKMQYIVNLFSSLLSYGILIFIFLNLWKYMYNDTNTIAGYSLIQMSWYLSITEIIWFSLRPKTLKKELSDDIKTGKIAYVLNKPFNYVSYSLSKYLGEAIVRTLLYSTLGFVISYIIIGTPTFFTVESIPFIIITYILSSIIIALLYILISLLALWVEDNEPFFWIFEKFILILGVMFPIEIFPKYIQPIIRYSPIYSTTYAPAKMFIDYSFKEFLNIIPFQIIYVILFSVLCALVYKKGVKKLSVNGG